MKCVECGQDRGKHLAPCEICGASAPKQLTERERLCLAYLDRLMEANAKMIGEAILKVQRRGGNAGCIGGAVVGNLRKRRLVSYLPELRAWRITQHGREVLREQA